MKKVALMTWIHHDNYGTVLQGLATKNVVNSLGHELEGIDYISEGYDRITKLEKLLNPSKVKEKLIQNIRGMEYYKNIKCDKRKIAFEEFRKKHLKLKKAQTSSELYALNTEYDAFICGSDQIWSPKEYNSKYYLDFVEIKEKKIAYAPSFGRSIIKDELVKKRIKESIEGFKHLSVREYEGAKLIKEISGREVKVVVDPTLLVSKKEWNQYESDIKIEGKYLVCYFLGNNESYWKHIEEISKKYNLKVIVIPIFEVDLKRDFTIMEGVGPGEFLSLIKNAELVCTDSFHGSIFSIIYNTAFLTYKRFSDKNIESQNSRIYNLLKLFNLEEKLISGNNDSIENIFNFDFEKVMKKVEQEKNKSMNYLINSLEDAFKYSMNKENYKITNTCSGCSICKNVCKHNAIKVELNELGFYEATIDKEKCTNCKICKKVCPFNGEKALSLKNEDTKLYMLRSNSSKILKTSTSGGAGYEISKALNKEGYAAIGCTYNKDEGKAEHKIVEPNNEEELYIFQGSKYIQSDTRDALEKIMHLNKAVIFGTPCQIAGVDKYLKLKKKREQFILVDLICHGVPSDYLWKKYLEEGKENLGYGDKPNVKFRFKEKSWKDIYICVDGKKKYVKRNSKDIFYKYFETQNIYMKSCYECNYRVGSQADIRIGDYWGEKYEKYRDTGASMVLGLTESGRLLLKRLETNKIVNLKDEDLNDYWSIQFPSNPIIPLYYNEIILELKQNKDSLNKIFNKYSKVQHLNQDVHLKYSKLKKIIRRQ